MGQNESIQSHSGKVFETAAKGVLNTGKLAFENREKIASRGLIAAQIAKRLASAKTPEEVAKILIEYGQEILKKLSKGETLTDGEAELMGAYEMLSGELVGDATGGSQCGVCFGQGETEGGTCGVCYGNGQLGGFYGGNDMALLTQYADTTNAAMKKKLISAVVETMDKLHIKASGSTPEEQIKSILDQIPNSRNGKSFRDSDESQVKFCRSLASAINKTVGKTIISMEAPAQLICQQVAEVVYSLRTGMQLEFLMVHEDLKHTLRNLAVLREQMAEVARPLNDLLAESEKPSLRRRAASLKGAVDLILGEVARQQEMLQHLLNVKLSDTDVSISKILSSDDELKSLVQNVDAEPGTSSFKNVLSTVLSGMGVTADYARLVDEALKTVQISLKDYADMKSTKQLNKKISEALMDVPKDKFSTEADKIIKAGLLLSKNFSKASNIKDILEKSGSAENKEMEGGEWDEDNIIEGGNTPYIGGDDDDRVYPTHEALKLASSKSLRKSEVKRTLQNKHEIRKVFFKTFDATMLGAIEHFSQALGRLVSQIGDNVATSDAFDEMRGAMTRLRPLLMLKNSYLYLIGYFNDAISKQRREGFIDDLRNIERAAERMFSAPEYAAMSNNLRDLKSSINTLIETMDKYSDRIKERFGGAQITGGDEGGDEHKGGDDIEINTKTSRALTHTLPELLTKFDYYYQVAKMKQSLKRSARDVDSYADKYIEMRAEAIAKEIDLVKRQTDFLEKRWAHLNKPVPAGGAPNAANDWEGLFTQESTNNASPIYNQLGAAKEATPKFINLQHSTRANFWRTVEAVDEYLRIFTSDLIKSKQDLQTVKDFLNDTDVVANWYSQKTGVLIHQVFDNMPSDISAAHAPEFPPDELKTRDNLDHYYSIVKIAGNNAANNVGVPYIPMFANSKSAGVRGVELIREVMKNFSILKNIMNVFIHIGNKVGGDSMIKKAFMSPVQIYKNLCEYLAVCSFDIGLNTRVGTANLTFALPNIAFGYDLVQPPIELLNQIGIFMRGVEDITETNKHHPTNEDNMFAYMLKGMCAKILVVCGLCDLTERPSEPLSFSPVRVMLGGAEETPKVHENLMELYLRLPLLAEFYRELFGFYSDDAAGRVEEDNIMIDNITDRITMIPDANGTFSDLIRLIFRKAHKHSVRDFSEREYNQLISIINKIWDKVKSSVSSSSEVLHMLADEINRRYGIVTNEEAEAYQTLFDDRRGQFGDRAASGLREYRDTDIAILPDEDDIDYDFKSNAPSTKYLQRGAAIKGKESKQSSVFISQHHMALLSKFRCKIDDYFKKAVTPYQAKKLGEETLNNLISASKTRLREAQGDEDRYHVAMSMLRGHNLINKSDYVRNMVFHETVVTGLNSLGAIYSLLNGFRNMVAHTDLEAANTVVAAAAGGAAATLDDLLDALREKYFGDAANVQIPDIPDRYRPAGGGVAFTNIHNNIALRDMIEAIYTIGNDSQKMVSARIDSSGSLSINWDKLTKVVEELMGGVKHYLDLFRPILDAKLIDRYTSNKRVGSLYWLQEHLVDKLVVGSRGVYNDDHQYMGLDDLTRVLNKSLRTALSTVQEFGQTMAGMVFYNSNIVHSGIHGDANNHRDANPESVDFSSPMGRLMFPVKGDKMMVDPTYTHRFAQLYKWDTDKWMPNQSMLFAFNQTLAKYLSVCYDSTAEKVYMPCISHFVNTVAAPALHDLRKTYPDMVSSGNGLKSLKGVDPSDDLYKLTVNVLTQLSPAANYRAYATLMDNLGVNGNTRLPEPLVGTLEFAAPAVVVAPAVAPPAAIDLVNPPNNNWANPFEPLKAHFNLRYKTTEEQHLRNKTSVPRGTTLTSAEAAPQGGFRRRRDPVPDNIIYTSLAMILKSLSTSVEQSGQTLYQLDNLMEVSTYEKEKLKTHLPYLRNMFKELICRGELLRKILSTGVNVTRNIIPEAAAGDASDVVEGLMTDSNIPVYVAAAAAAANRLDHHNSVSRLTSIINSIMQASRSVITCIDTVLRELADTDPKYLELRTGFFSEYKTANNCLPLTPLSSALAVLGVSDAHADDASLLPFTELQESGQRYLHGMRGLFGYNDAKLDDVLSNLSSIPDMFNLIENRGKLESGRFMSHAKSVAQVARLVYHDTRLRSNLVELVTDNRNDAALQDYRVAAPAAAAAGTGALARSVRYTAVQLHTNAVPYTPQIPMNATIATDTDNADLNKDNKPVYSAVKLLRETVDLTDSIYHDESVKMLAEHLNTIQPRNADELRITNLMDESIMPINVHALMRSIPLANLYNYSYTFDRLIVDLYYGAGEEYGSFLIKKLCNNGWNDNFAAVGAANRDNANNRYLRSPKELFMAMLMRPYMKLETADTLNYFANMMRGATNLPLGRPKFLSEEVFGKALFGNLLTSDDAHINTRSLIGDYRVIQELHELKENSGQEHHPESYIYGDLVTKHDIGLANARRINNRGKIRSSTLFIRNLVFMTNVYRTMRHRLRHDVLYSKSKILSGTPLIAPENTEFRGAQTLPHRNSLLNLEYGIDRSNDINAIDAAQAFW